MNFKERISIQFTNLTKTDKKISHCLMQHPEYLTDHSVQAAAKLIETSPAALVRLAKKIGYKGLADFKIDLEKYGQNKPERAESKDVSLVQRVLDNYRENIDLIQSQLDENQMKAIADLILTAQRVKILGIGSSGLRAEEMVYYLLYQDIYTESVTSKTKMLYLARNLGSEDVLIFYTVSGNKDLADLFVAARAAGAKVIVITMVASSYVTKYADQIVILPSNLQALSNQIGDFYQLDNRSQFSIFSEILAAYINQRLK
ncbi:MurR/RpiR family transcriptional regulator [Streptococcus catagoni]|uniref:MurR/RpiR family transcriptional regulator n=1 Tax=Streptococcus catagoni TaxID=2654874 RepID=UPI00140D1B90|nr:MurR/RpiR family transcriptional regulator [Streptococcus catagoni]